MGWKDRAEPVGDSWRDRAEPEGGAEGGSGGDTSKPLDRGTPEVPEDPEAKKAEQQRRMALAISGMTGGQNIASLSPEERDAFNTKSTEKALGQGIALARGVPLTGAHIDELSALLQPGDYAKNIGPARQAVNQSVADNPAAPWLGSLAFAPALPPTAAGRIALGTLSGASEGAGAAPNMSAVPKASLLGGGAGLAMSLLGEGAIQGGKSLGGKAQKLSDATNATELAAEQEARAGAVASTAGKEGGLTSTSMKTWDRLENAMFNPAASEESKAAARAFINSPEGQKLYNQVLANYIEDAPNQMARLLAAKEASAAARAANDPTLIQQAASSAANAKLNDLGGVTGRLAELARRTVPTAVGTAVGGAPGAMAGALFSGSIGKPGTVLSNMLKNPSMYRPLLAGEAALGATGSGMSSAAPAVAREALAPWMQFLDEKEQP